MNNTSERIMEIYTTSQARENLFKLVDQAAISHEPVYIVGKRHKAVLISEEDYASLLETTYISSIPGLKESILKSSQEPLESFADVVDWED
jgi:antitoxin YefM